MSSLPSFGYKIAQAMIIRPFDLYNQHAKKVMSYSPGLVDFALGQVIFVLNLLDGQVLFFGEIQITEGL